MTTKRSDLGLLVLRVGAGVLLMGHGWGKVLDLFSGNQTFSDPIGIGPVPSLALAAFAEFVCSLAVVLGVKVRWTAIPPLITMLVAALIHHAGDDIGERELPLLFATAFLALAVLGGGRYGLETLFRRRRRRA
jgi:putative oxidoreductase